METTTYYTDIDLLWRTAYLTTVGEDGTVAGQKEAPLPPQGPAAVLRLLRARERPPDRRGDDHGLVLVADLLSGEGIDLKLAHAKYLKAISYAKVSGRQSRLRDARATAQVRHEPRSASDWPRLRLGRSLSAKETAVPTCYCPS